MITTLHDPIRSLPEERYKLVSANDTLLGTITINPAWWKYLQEGGTVNFAPPLRRPAYSDFAPVRNSDLRIGTLVRERWSEHGPNCLRLIGMTIDEYETIDGCSFAPSAAYIRSVLEP